MGQRFKWCEVVVRLKNLTRGRNWYARPDVRGFSKKTREIGTGVAPKLRIMRSARSRSSPTKKNTKTKKEGALANQWDGEKIKVQKLRNSDQSGMRNKKALHSKKTSRTDLVGYLGNAPN